MRSFFPSILCQPESLTCNIFSRFVVFIDLVGTLALPAALSFTCYLVVIAIIPSQPTPTMSLILLALILGLPALLIVVTSRKISYIGWMVSPLIPRLRSVLLLTTASPTCSLQLVYLLSLPIWNFVLPAYAYWHFDDFSWGETRRVEGEVKGGAGHGDKDGVFDSRNIVMKVHPSIVRLSCSEVLTDNDHLT